MTPKKIHILTRDVEILDAETQLTRAWVNLNPHKDRTEYTDLSQVWHDANEEPEKGKSIISIGATGVSSYKWVDEWRCDCGKDVITSLYNLNNGKTTSCGCYKKERTIARFTTHGLSNKSPLYATWKSMKERCCNSNHHAFLDYGGRGISVCEEWINDYKSFYLWSIANGWTKGLSIDRIDNNKGYCPENCRVADRFTQARNKRNNKEISFECMVWHSLAQFCEDKQLDYKTVQQRLYRGNTLDKAIINAERKTI